MGKENQGTRTDLCQKSDKSINPIDTKKALAKSAGVSHDTIMKVKKKENLIAGGCNPQLLQNSAKADPIDTRQELA